MIKHLMRRIVHTAVMRDGLGVWVTVKDGKAIVNFHGNDPVTLNEGDNLHVGLKLVTPASFMHTASMFNGSVAYDGAEVTSPLAEVSRMPTRRRTVASRYLDPDAPLDTPSLDTSFHDREMDI